MDVDYPKANGIDLHTHTTASDGQDTPRELVQNAARAGISVLGLTDHDTIDGIAEATAAATDAGVTLVPGVEMSTTVDVGEVHILGYFVDVNDDAFVGVLRDLASARVRRVTAMIDRAQSLGYEIDGDAILAQAEHGSIGRPHIARELVRIGAAESVNDAFERYLKAGRPIYVPREPLAPEDAVRILTAHGVVPVLAHPFSTRDVDGVLKRLRPCGLAGMEVWYAEYSPEQQAELADIARAWDLVATGGSDYHGAGVREGRNLGAAPVPSSVWDALNAAKPDRSAS